MSYVALYRKYRSQSFDEVMGQEQVTVTLRNAIRSGKIAHAYLFYGARGCGKTSTARLLARALNCTAQDGPTPDPCGVCPLCTAIRDGACLDVVEMDAASETGIDDVREKIIENVQYAPGEGRYKVFIIDEVHDLSARAFDALLKTLEEPPAHVVFILATTEYHKVPVTIRSRCLQYHFKRGTLQDLAASIQRVIDQEGYRAEPEAVQAIARGAEGSWRDALSLLEQVLAYADGDVTAEIVHRALGSVGTETLARVTETLAEGDMCAAFAIAGELIDSGKDVRQLLAALSGHLRDLMLICAGARNAAAQELGPERYALLETQATRFDAQTLLAMTAIVAAAEREIRFTNQHRWLLESTLLRMMPSNIAQKAPPAPRPAGNPPAPTVRRETVASTPSVVPRPDSASDRQIAAPSTFDASDSENSEAAPAEEPAAAELRTAGNRTPAVGVPAKPAPASRGPGADTTAAASNGRFAPELTLEVIVRQWPHILARFKKISPQGAPWLEKGEIVQIDGRTIVLGFTDSFAQSRIQNNSKGREKFEQIINESLKTEGLKIRCIAREPERRPGAAPVPQPAVTAAEKMANLLEPSEAEGPQTGGTIVSEDNAGSGYRAAEATPEPGHAAQVPTGTEPVAGKAQDSGAVPDGNGVSLVDEVMSRFGGSIVRTEPRSGV